MGVTVHYVDPDTFEMRSSVLGVRRFKHSHTAEAVAKILLCILNKFRIRKKVQNIVTDNAANFCKAFTLCVDATEVNPENRTIPSEIELDESDNDYDTDRDSDVHSDDRQGINVFDVLCASAESEEVEILPPHKRCGNHTLNLVASNDCLKARDDKSYKRSYDRAMAKVQALSNAVNRSLKLNDIVEEIAGTTFINPTCTRWSSNFYAVERVISIGAEKVKVCQASLKQAAVTDNDMLFLTSYAKVMKPVVHAMNVLQGEKTTYLGHLIPTIIGLKCKLKKSTDKVVVPLVKALSDGIDKRFSSVLADKEHLVASVLLPQFKLNFLPEDARLDIKRHVLDYLREVEAERKKTASQCVEIQPTTAITSSEPKEDEDEDIYSFMNYNEHDVAPDTSSPTKQLEDYLASKLTSIQTLKDY